jgi:hypothetical protein
MAANDQNGLSDIVYQIPVFREINLFFDWFGSLIWYWQIGVAVGIVLIIWVFLKIVALIFGSADE